VDFYAGEHPDDREVIMAKNGGALALVVVAGVAFAAAGTDGEPARQDAGAGVRDARTTAWQSGGTTFRRQASTEVATCFDHSFGQVRQFFASTECSSLYRVLLESDDLGNTAVILLSWIEMPDRDAAEDLKSLIDVYGTGDITPPDEEVLRASGVRFSGRYYGSRLDGRVLVVAEAEASDGPVSGEALDRMAETAAEFPAG
jgi:hypothetical protein